VRIDETQELTKEGDISFFQKELEASGSSIFSFYRVAHMQNVYA